MIKSEFHEKIALILSFLILSNYLFLSLGFFQIIIKINFLFFFIAIIFFYIKNFSENIYLKIFFILIVVISLGTPTFDWDPRSIWMFHGKRIFYDQSIFSIADNYASFSHNDYPNLVPALSSSLASLFGYWNEIFPKLSFPLMFLPPLVFAYAFFKNEKYLIFLSLVFFFIGKQLFNGWADGLIAIYFCLSAFLMYILFIDRNEIRINLLHYFIALCFFISLTLIKNEGIVLLFILFLVTSLFNIFKYNKKNILKLFYLSSSFIPIFLWKFFCYNNGIFNDHINNDVIMNLIPRINIMDNYISISYFLFLNEKFIFSLIIFISAFIINRDKKLFSYVFMIITLYILVLFFIFLSTPVDFYFQLNSAAARIVKTLSFTTAFFGLYLFSLRKHYS